MNSSKPKPKDESTNKFLQRLAGKKAIGPPPTPRPVIGEHPVRILMRENRDTEETFKEEDSVAAETLYSAPANSLFVTDHPTPELQTGFDMAVLASKEVNNQEVDVLTTSNEIESASSAFNNRKLDQKISVVSDAKDAPLINLNNKALGHEVETKAGDGTTLSANNAEERLNSIRKQYRLNSGEFAVYKELYLMTHAVGKTECSFVVSELMALTNMLERRVRDNIRRLKENGWIVLLEGYDFENREKARYRINSMPEFS